MEYQEKIDWLVDQIGECIVFDEHADALIGYVKLPDGTFRAAYNKAKLVQKLADDYSQDELDKDDDPYMMALDWYYYNILGLGLSEGTPVFLEGFYDQDFSDLEIDDEDHAFMQKLIEDGNWGIFECDAESFEFDYLLVVNGDKMKALNITEEGFTDSVACLYQFTSEVNSSASA